MQALQGRDPCLLCVDTALSPAWASGCYSNHPTRGRGKSCPGTASLVCEPCGFRNTLKMSQSRGEAWASEQGFVQGQVFERTQRLTAAGRGVLFPAALPSSVAGRRCSSVCVCWISPIAGVCSCWKPLFHSPWDVPRPRSDPNPGGAAWNWELLGSHRAGGWVVFPNGPRGIRSCGSWGLTPLGGLEIPSGA